MSYMLKQSKVWLALLGATVALGALVGTASARNLSISNQNIRATWTAMEFSNPSAGVLVRCPVTLEGSLHSRTIAKVLNSLIGFITRAIVGEGSCTGGTARVRTETLPWHVTYQGFTGTLPNILTIRTTVVRPGFDVTATFFGFPLTCRFRASNVNGVFNREVGGVLTNVQVEGRGLVGEGGFGCESGNLAGTSATLTLLGAVTRLTVTLI
jgi:hypothetical protein